MKAATLKWKWVLGMTGGYMVCLTGTAEPMIEGMVMGRDMAEAVRELAEFNARRAALGLTQFRV